MWLTILILALIVLLRRARTQRLHHVTSGMALLTPPLPAEALAVPGPRHMAPDLLFHPVFNEAEALAGISHAK